MRNFPYRLEFYDLAFSTRPDLKRAYESPFGNVRFAKLLEFLDIVAGNTCFNHTGDSSTFVTASVDNIEVACKMPITSDVVVRSRVDYVGRSSLDIGIQVLTREKDRLSEASMCFFTMVGLGKDGRPVDVTPKVVPSTVLEQKLYEDALKRKTDFKEAKNTSGFSKGDLDELVKIDELVRTGAVSAISIGRTSRLCPYLMCKENTNIYGKIFGGYIMRIAYELAWNLAEEHSKKRPVIVSVDRVNFLQPVEVGDTVEFDAAICYVGNSSMNVEVDVRRRDSGGVTNTCSFTFVAVDEVGKTVEVPKVYPSNREEEKMFLRGFRRYQRITAQRLQPF